MRYREDGLVYYALDATRTEMRLKIGWTGVLAKRLESLSGQTMSRQSPLLLALEAGGTAQERQRHEQFAHLRLIGEWFQYEDDLRDFVAGLPHPYSFLCDRPALWTHAGGWRGFTGWVRPANGGPVAADADGDEVEAEVPYVPVARPKPIDF